MIFARTSDNTTRKTDSGRGFLLFVSLAATILVLAAGTALAEEGDLRWAVSAGGTETDRGESVAALPDRGAVVTGSFGSIESPPGFTATFGVGDPNETTLTGVGDYDIFVARYNSDGTLNWAVQAGGAGLDEGFGIAALEDGTSLVTGRFEGEATFGEGTDAVTLTAPGGVDVFIARYDPDGTLVWAKRAGGNDWAQGHSIAALSDGTSFVTGYFEGTATFGPGELNETMLTTPGFQGMFVAQYNADGTLGWAVRAGGSGGYIEGNGIAALATGATWVTGALYGPAKFGWGDPNEIILYPPGDWDIFVAMYNPDGTLAWAQTAGGAGTDRGLGIAVVPDLPATPTSGIRAVPGGSVLVTGSYENTAVFGDPQTGIPLTAVDYSDVFVARYLLDGTLDWAVSAGGDREDDGYGVASLPDGSSLATGEFRGTAIFGPGDPNETSLTSQCNSDFFLAKYDPDGALEWVRRAGGTNTDGVGSYSVAALEGGTAFATGTYRGAPASVTSPGHGSVVFGPGEDNETHLVSVGAYDAFVAKFEGSERYTISGTVTLVGGTASVEDVTITLSGDADDTTTPASDGTYSFTDLPVGTYSVEPTLSEYDFEPTDRQYDPLESDQTNQDFTGTYVPPTYGVSGTVTLIGGSASVEEVTLTLSGAVADTTNPDADGIYSFAALEEGTYTVTPSLDGYDFEPSSRLYDPLNVDQTGQDFVGTYIPPTYSISGTVTLEGGTAVPTAVLLTLSGDADQTTSPASDGTYSFTDLPEGTYTVTPSLEAYTFEPTVRSYDPLNADQTGQDFTGTYVPPPRSISGTVTLIGGSASPTAVVLTLSGAANQTTNPASDGSYSFTDLAEGTYTVTPSLERYSFEPALRSYDPLGSDQTGQDFVGTYIPPTYSISGTVTLEGGTAAPTDVVLTLSGDENRTTSPAADGTYSFSGLLEGTYAVTPTLADYTFTPTSRQYTPLNVDRVGQDFAGVYTPPTYNILGTITLVGGTASVTDVTVVLGGDTIETTNPDPDGSYSFTDLLEGTYAVGPSLAGYIFEPTTREYTPLRSDQINQNFTGTYVPGTYTISGTVTLLGDNPVVTDVALELFGDVEQIVYPNSDGTYSFVDLPAGNYVIVPSLEGYIFEPTERVYVPLDSDWTEQDFVGDPGIRGGSGEPCFVATAAYGTPASKEVDTLRLFRDKYLLTNRPGAAFVQAYYRFSPPVARFIAARAPLRTAVRALLAPAVAVAKLALGSSLAQVAGVIGAAFLAVGILVGAHRRRARPVVR